MSDPDEVVIGDFDIRTTRRCFLMGDDPMDRRLAPSPILHIVTLLRCSNSHFVGPNLKDTFERKTKRMFEHQLPLSHDHVEGVDVREAMVKGRIFYATSDCQPIELPKLMSAEHLRSRWVRRSEFEAAPHSDAIRYGAVAKPFWLSAEADAGNESGLLNKREIGAWLGESAKRSERPVLINQLEESEGCWGEVERFFVVPNGWPGKPKKSDGDGVDPTIGLVSNRDPTSVKIGGH